MRDPVEPTNTQLIASTRAAVGRAPARGGAADAARRCGRWPAASPDRLGPPLPGGDVYTDDKAPVEWLVDKSIVDYASDSGE